MMNGHWYDRDAIDAGLRTVLDDVERQKAKAAKAQEAQASEEEDQTESS